MKRDKRVMKHDIGESKPKEDISADVKIEQNGPTNDLTYLKLNDIGFRLVLIPFFGIAIPLISDMIENVELSTWAFKLSFLYSIGIAWIVWEGNKFLLFTLRNYFDWFERPLRKIAALVFVVPFYTIPISILLLAFWFKIFANGIIEWPKIWLATAIILVCVVFIVHVYETVFLVKEAESEKLMNARLERSKAEAELQILKSQIDPHFMFNSLNTLSYFIDKDPPKAKLFNQKLSDVYRYILQNRDRNFVILGEELSFVKDYFMMLSIRFEDAVKLDVQIEENQLSKYLVLPISIQLLVENAVKHNEFSDIQPLTISILLNDDFIEVVNKLRVKKIIPSSKIGLINLDERCKLLIKRSLIRIENDKLFRIKLPILKT